MELCEKAAYLKGLFEGVQIDRTTNENKILVMVIDLLQNLATEVEKLKVNCNDNKELLYELDENLNKLENFVNECSKSKLNKLIDCKTLDDGSHCGCNCKKEENDGDYIYNESDEYVKNVDSNPDTFEVLCPSCQQVVQINGSNLKDGDAVCPICGAKLDFDFNVGETFSEN